MKRWLIIVAVFLLAGAVVNVAVAWGCALRYKDGSTYSMQWGSEIDRAWWYVHRPDGFVQHNRPVDIEGFHWFGLSGTVFSGRSKLIRLRCGWPAQTVEGSRWRQVGFVGPWVRALDGGYSVDLFRDRWVPLGILWPGVAANTLFYATILWLLIPGPFALRRFIRVKRGLCPACAYPVGESAVCSECGRALSSRA